MNRGAKYSNLHCSTMKMNNQLRFSFIHIFKKTLDREMAKRYTEYTKEGGRTALMIVETAKKKRGFLLKTSNGIEKGAFLPFLF